MSSKTIVASASRSASGDSGPLAARGVTIAVGVSVTTQSGTTPTLDFDLQWSNDGVDWFNSQPVDNYTQITTVVPTRAVKEHTVKGTFYRLRWTLGGATPAYTFSAYEHR